MRRLLILDLDGTLVDSLPGIVASVGATLSGIGRDPLPKEAVRRWIGHGVRALWAGCLGVPENEVPGEILETYLTHQEEHCLDETKPYPGVPETLARLCNEGWEMAVLSNKTARIVVRIVDGLGWSGSFTAVAGGDTFENRKPSPVPIVRLRERTGVGDGPVALVGDSAPDLDAARAAGIPAIASLYGYTDPDRLLAYRPAGSIRRFADLPGVLERIVGRGTVQERAE